MTKKKSPSRPPILCRTCRKLEGPHRIMTDEGLVPTCDACLRAWQKARKAATGAEVTT